MQLTERETTDMLLAVMYDFCHENVDKLISFLEHVEFDIGAIESAGDIVEALPAHYRIKHGKYDIERLEIDLVSWGPIARAIETERRKQAAAKKG